MSFVDYLKRFFGIRDSDPRSNNSPQQHYPPFDRRSLELDVREYQEPFGQVEDGQSFEIDQFFEQHISQFENLMRNITPFIFSFGFGSPDSHDDPPHDPISPFGPSQPNSGGFPFFGFPNIFEFGDKHKGIPGMEEDRLSPRDDVLSPRDEVLKPSYRSSSHHKFKDEDYDDLVKEKGPGVIIDMLRKSEEDDKVNERQIVRAPISKGHFSSTKFSFVNGESVQEQITRLPDGTYEKRVTKTDARGETNTVVSHHTEDEIASSMRGRFDIGGGFGRGPLLW